MLTTAAGSAFCGVGMARADTVTLAPVADATLYDDQAGVWADGSGEHFFVGNTANQARRRTVLRFNLSAIPPGSTITSASLRLTVNKTRAATSMPVELYRVTSSWGEGASNATNNEGFGAQSLPNDATWIHRFYDTARWNNEGGDFAATRSAVTTVPTGSSGNHTWSSSATGNSQMLSDVSGWVNDPTSNFGWILIGNELGNQNARRYASRTNPTTASRPQLTIVYTPAPVACNPADIAGGGSNGTSPDGVVDGNDFVAFINSFAIGDVSVNRAADLNSDGVIDGSDFVAFINAFALGC